MKEPSILSQRKDLKKRGHAVIKSHYLILVFLVLVMTLFGTEFRTSLSGWRDLSPGTESESEKNNGPGNMLSANDVISASTVLQEIASGNLASGSEKAAQNAQAFQEKLSGSKALGTTNGVLGQVVNGLLSGQLFAHLGQTIFTITRSHQATAFIFVLGAFLWYAMIFILLKNVYSAVLRRVFLVARVYRHVDISDITWFAVVRKWFSACRILFREYLYTVLWSLTIIGGFIKCYSYWAVSYIAAENPSVSPKEAITLSRRMMNGHKFELLKYQISFIGWHLLALVTFGISDLVYGNAYRLAAYTEFYAALREEMLAKDPDCSRILNDPCLFHCPDRITLAETYFDVVEEITEIHENRIEPTGWRKLVADWFGVWLYSSNKKIAYDRQEERSLAVKHNKMAMQGEVYPQRLSPLWKNRKESRPEQFSFVRNYTVWSLVRLFIFFCFVGWSWEVALHFMQTGQFANRGTLHGPWLPIYGTGGIIVLVLCSRFRKNPVAEFFSAILLCGVLEYVSAWSLEMKYNQRWWSYDGYFLNLHGRICAEGLLVFGVGCCVVVYLAAPAFDSMISKIRQKALIALCLVLGAFYSVDLIYSQSHPNMAEGAIESQVEAEPETLQQTD